MKTKGLFTLVLICSIVFLGQFYAMAEEVGYILGNDDVIEFSVWDFPELKSRMVIRPDGMISVPLVGELQAANLTPVELEEELEERLKLFFNAPQVTISVVEFGMNRVSVLGAVTKPGMYPVKKGTRLLETLALAGLREEDAFLEQVTLTRNDTVLVVNVDQLLREGGHQNYVMENGDTIFVPQIKRQVFVLGEVKKPGVYPIDKVTTPADVLAMAGGPTERADLKNVKIIHRASNKPVETIDLEKFLQAESTGYSLYLENGDVIQIEEVKSINWEKIFTYAAGIKIIHDLIVNW